MEIIGEILDTNDAKKIYVDQLAESLNTMINVIIISTDPTFSYLKKGFSKNEFNPPVIYTNLSQFDLHSFGLDPGAFVFIQNDYGPGVCLSIFTI